MNAPAFLFFLVIVAQMAVTAINVANCEDAISAVLVGAIGFGGAFAMICLWRPRRYG